MILVKKDFLQLSTIKSFQVFLNEVHKFIQKELENKTDLEYENYVLYIASFKLLQIREIVKFRLESNARIGLFIINESTIK